MHDIWIIFYLEWMKQFFRLRFKVIFITGIVIAIAMAAVIAAITSKKPLEESILAENVSGAQQHIDQMKMEKNTALKDPYIDPRSIQEMDKSIQDEQNRLAQQKNLLEQYRTLREGDNWKPALETVMTYEKNQKDEIYGGPASKAMKDQEMNRLQYALDNDIIPVLKSGGSAFKTMFNNFQDYIASLLLPFFVIILIADMVSMEKASGTIKLLLVRPISRTRVLLGKWLAAITITIVFTLIFYLVLYLAQLAFAGTYGADDPVYIHQQYHFVDAPEIVDTSDNATADRTKIGIPNENHDLVPAWQYAVMIALITLIPLITVATAAFFCSTLFSSPVISIAVPMCLVLMGSITSTILSRFIGKAYLISWFFPSNLNLSKYWDGVLGSSLGKNISLGDGLSILFYWFAIMIVVSILYFRQKDILNA